MKGKLFLILGVVLSLMIVAISVYKRNCNARDDFFDRNVAALAEEEVDSGTCCPDENSECVLSWVTIPSHAYYGGVGPCK